MTLRRVGMKLLLVPVLAASLSAQGIIESSGGGGGTITVDGAGEAANLNSSTPAAPSNAVNVDWQISGDDVSANLLLSDIGTATFGGGSGFTWTFDAGATDPTITFGSGLTTFASTGVTFDGSATDLKVSSTGQLQVDTGAATGLENGICFGTCATGLGLSASSTLTVYVSNTFPVWDFSGALFRGIDANARIRGNASDGAASPSYGWNVDGGNEGMYYIGSGNIGFTSNGNKFLELGGSQTALVHNPIASTGDTELVVKEGAGQSSAALQVVDASDGALFSVNVGGGFGGPGRALASLGTPANGSIEYCTDCLKGSDPCSASSTGAFAFRVAGAWQCM